jgi:hypothetical protein
MIRPILAKKNKNYNRATLSANRRPGGQARKIASEHHINWPEILPLTAIAKSHHEKIKRFQEQRLEKGYKNPRAITSDVMSAL